MDAQKLKPVRSLLLIADVSAYRMARSPVTAVLPSLEANLARAHAHTYTHIHFLALCMNLFFLFLLLPCICVPVCASVWLMMLATIAPTPSVRTRISRACIAQRGDAKVQRHRVMKRAFVTRKNVTPGVRRRRVTLRMQPKIRWVERQ